MTFFNSGEFFLCGWLIWTAYKHVRDFQKISIDPVPCSTKTLRTTFWFLVSIWSISVSAFSGIFCFTTKWSVGNAFTMAFFLTAVLFAFFVKDKTSVSLLCLIYTVSVPIYVSLLSLVTLCTQAGIPADWFTHALNLSKDMPFFSTATAIASQFWSSMYNGGIDKRDYWKHSICQKTYYYYIAATISVYVIILRLSARCEELPCFFMHLFHCVASNIVGKLIAGGHAIAVLSAVIASAIAGYFSESTTTHYVLAHSATINRNRATMRLSENRRPKMEYRFVTSTRPRGIFLVQLCAFCIVLIHVTLLLRYDIIFYGKITRVFLN